MQEVDADLRRYKKAKDWRREDAPELFSTDGSFDWFARIHRHELVESGALIVRAGRAGNVVHVDRIGPVIQRILEAESRKTIEPGCHTACA